MPCQQDYLLFDIKILLIKYDYRLFPQLSLALYLDVDIVVQGDIVELWELTANTSLNYTMHTVQR